MWGLKDLRPEEGRNKGFVNPIFDDGLLEVVGLEGGWKSWAALSGIRKDLHGRRIAQASELKITYHSPKGVFNTIESKDGLNASFAQTTCVIRSAKCLLVLAVQDVL